MPAVLFTYGRAMAPRSSCLLERWLTPRRRPTSFPASRLGSEMGGEPLSRVNVSLLLLRRCRRGRIGRVSLSFSGIGSCRRSRRRMQRRQMHVVAVRRQWGQRNLLIGIAHGRSNRRRRRILTAKMQPLLNVLGAARDPPEHPAGLVRRRRGGGHGRRSGLRRRRSLDGCRHNAHGALLRRRHWLRAVAEDDFLGSARQRLRVAYVLIAGESRILAAIGVNKMDRLDAGRDQFGDLGLVLVFFLGDERLNVLIALKR